MPVMMKVNLILLKLVLAFHQVSETGWHFCSCEGQHTQRFKSVGVLAAFSVKTAPSCKLEMGLFVSKRSF